MKRVAVVQGSPSSVVQSLFRELAERWQSDIRIAGVVEEPHGLADRKCNAGYLRSIASGTLYPIFQDLGPGAEACHLQGTGAISATEAIEQDIAAGCDLVMLSKFGKLEASREGLCGAFAAAIDAGLPVLTSVSPAFERAWEIFAAPLFHVLPADPNEIEAWRRAILNSTAVGRSLQA
ncbi:hypothetical protein QFZ88_005869 [Mesorhizobium sp. YL-MeA3-2017]|jgi:hypothetical protein|uniref:DUF2478 domain-containing protein n=1 Tax=Mesorhizobium sp. YL-MeA3-2017 TaxID=3042284 RepID=UPI0015CCDBAD|nr:DUF2478 domain-containing protein [Mesorhizobium sp. YL-MeA3-2017]MDQ0333487.1 hypothetical protein [Mesorhizobium sp. YL-MeA3-2017]